MRQGQNRRCKSRLNTELSLWRGCQGIQSCEGVRVSVTQRIQESYHLLNSSKTQFLHPKNGSDDGTVMGLLKE